MVVGCCHHFVEEVLHQEVAEACFRQVVVVLKLVPCRRRHQVGSLKRP